MTTGVHAPHGGRWRQPNDDDDDGNIVILYSKVVGVVVWPGLYLANLKNDNSTVSITNTGCIRCDN